MNFSDLNLEDLVLETKTPVRETVAFKIGFQAGALAIGADRVRPPNPYSRLFKSACRHYEMGYNAGVNHRVFICHD